MKRLRTLWATVLLTVGSFLLYGTQAALRAARRLGVALRRVSTFHVGLVLLLAGVGMLAGVTIAVAAHFAGSAALWAVMAAWLIGGGLVLAGDELEIRLPWR